MNNLFVAPLFLNKPAETDFLMTIRDVPDSKDDYMKVTEVLHDEFASETQRRLDPELKMKPRMDTIKCVVQPFPKSLITVGQTEPKQRVPYPDSKELKDFRSNFIAFQIAKAMERSEKEDEEDIELQYINDVIFRDTALEKSLLTNCLKSVAVQGNDNKWSFSNDYEGIDKLGSKFTPEQVRHTIEDSILAVYISTHQRC
jgi:hypothetical protein